MAWRRCHWRLVTERWFHPRRNSLHRLLAQAHVTVLYEDDHIVAVNKPSGLASQGGSKVSMSVDSILSDKFKLVHRLDKMCSGVLVLAKDAHSAKVVSQWIGGHEVEKEYWAIVHSTRHPGEILGHIRKGVVDVSIPIQGKQAKTRCHIVTTDSERNISLVKLYPQTGRMHQLRKHCASGLNAAILGDSTYGKTRGDQKVVLDEILGDAQRPIFLHCRQMKVPYIDGMTTHGFVKVEAPFPEYFRRVFDICGWSVS